MKPTAMPTDAVEDAYPLTRLQAGMLFHSEYQPDSAIYHDIFSYQLRAPFDAQALRDALQQLVDSHPILRTSFELASFSQPLQLVHRAVAAPLQIDDLRPLAENEQAAALAAWIEAEKRRPFDWAAPPLLRFHAHRRAADSFQFSVSFHHAILDGWSVASMLTELFQRYLARLGKAPAPAPPPRATFRDYVALERQALESEECRQFWRRALAEASTTTLPRRAALGFSNVQARGTTYRVFSMQAGPQIVQVADHLTPQNHPVSFENDHARHASSLQGEGRSSKSSNPVASR